MSTTAAREAVVVVLDVSAAMAPHAAIAKTVCSTLIQQKFVLARRDLVGLVFGGTTATANRLNEAAPDAYRHISAVRGVNAPNAEYLAAIEAVATQPAPFDMLDAVVVADHMLHEAIGDKKFNKRVVLVSSCAGEVRRKEDMGTIVDALKKRGVSVIVIGVDFDEEEDDGRGVDWAALSTKQRNEKVLHFMAAEIGGDSIVVPVNDAQSALSALRKKNMPQRTYCKVLLDIGDIKIPVALYVKCLLQRVPSMAKVTAKGAGVVTERKHYSARAPADEIDAADRTKAYVYGRSNVPFNEVDEAQMKFQCERSMSVLGFVPAASVPAHVLQGGSKAVAPLPDDVAGATALAAFVHGMAHLERAMLVRLAWRNNCDPALGVCFAAPKAGRAILYFALLPFAEDYRHYQFRAFADVPLSAAERAAVEALVAKMALGAGELRPKDTFNPMMQHYYQCLKERYLRPDAPLPALPPAVVQQSSCWGGAGNVLQPMLDASIDERKRARELFPPPPPKKEDGVAGKVFWFAKGGDAVTLDSYAPADKKARVDTYFASGGTGGTGASPSPGGSTPSLRDAVDVAAVGAAHGGKVTTVDPVGSFIALVDRKGEDTVGRAIDEMAEVVMELVRVSIADQYYKRIAAAVDALRLVCVREAEPRAFNRFLLNLMLTTQAGAHHKLWALVGKAVGVITTAECEDSDVAEADAARHLQDRRPAHRAVVDEGGDEDDDLFGMLE
jgi:ATP-dependent DNA helicase 2 subunit 2